MSYEIVRHISERNRTITSACNNVRPLIYSTGHLSNDDGTRETFIKTCLVAFHDGDFQSKSENCWKFNYINRIFRRDYKELDEKLNKIIWENYDYSTKTQLYSDDEIEQARNTLKNKLYEIYLKVEQRKIGYFVLKGTQPGYYVCKLSKYRSELSNTKFKVFDSEEAATEMLTELDLLNYFEIYELKEGD